MDDQRQTIDVHADDFDGTHAADLAVVAVSYVDAHVTNAEIDVRVGEGDTNTTPRRSLQQSHPQNRQ
jgi:hypothetical protein